MAKADTWLPLYVGDYLADTGRFSLEEHGAYMLLIMDYWRNGAPPDDDVTIARILGVTPAVWRRLTGVKAKFKLTDGRLTHSRIEREIVAAGVKKAKAEDKARVAAEARWGRGKVTSPSNAPSNAPSIPQAMLPPCPLPLPSPLTTEDQKLPSSADAADRLAGDEKKAADAGIPDCPHDELIALYHEHCKTLPEVREWTPARQAFMRQRWRERFARGKKPVTTKEEGLAWFGRFFAYVNECPLLVGEEVRWTCNLEWLMRPQNFVKVLEGNYADKRAA